MTMKPSQVFDAFEDNSFNSSGFDLSRALEATLPEHFPMLPSLSDGRSFKYTLLLLADSSFEEDVHSKAQIDVEKNHSLPLQMTMLHSAKPWSEHMHLS
jgi:hypothetical protein